MKLSQKNKQEINILKIKVREVINMEKPHPFGHCFVWVTANLVRNNGKGVRVRFLAGSACSEDISLLEKRIRLIPQIHTVEINLD